MKILVLLMRWKGGVGCGLRNVSEEMKKAGHVVDVISREDDLGVYSFLKSISKLRKIVTKKMKENNYDIIYTHDWSLAFPLLFPYRLYKDKHYCMFHGNNFGIGKILKTQAITGNLLGDKLIVMAPSLKKKFPNANLIYCGVDSKKRFKPLKMKRKYFGWMEKITETVTKETVEKICHALNMPLLIAKNIPYDDMNLFYNKCKIFFSLPPGAAGFQGSYLEAMAAGVPIIIGNNEGGGILLPFDKVLKKDDCIDSIKKIVKNPKKINYRKWLIDNGFSWEIHTKQVLKLFSKP